MYEHNAFGYWSGLALCLTKVRSSRTGCPATALIIHTTVVRVSHDILMNVRRLVLFSRQIVVSCFHVFSRLLCDCGMTFVQASQNFRIVNLPKFCGDRFATSHERHTNIARQSGDIFW